MKKRVFVPVESYLFASPEIRLNRQHTDIGLLAEALVLFDHVDLNLTSAQNLVDVLRGFLAAYGSINPFLDLISEGAVRIHYFDFMSAPIEKDGVFSYWNIQDADARKSHSDSFRDKILQSSTIDACLPKARHRQRLYDVVMRSAIIDGSEDYVTAIEAARESSKMSTDIESSLNAFKNGLPDNFRRLFPDRIEVRAEYDSTAKITRHHFNFDFKKLGPILSEINFDKHSPAVGLIQTHRILSAARKHNYDTYLPHPLSEIVLAKMDSFSDGGKKFTKTRVDLTRQAAFPDIRGSFNDGTWDWKTILEMRNNAGRFQEWFIVYGGKPETALETYGEEYRASTGITGYREKVFSFATYALAAVGAGIGASVAGAEGAVAGTAAGRLPALIKDLFKASEEDGWKPRFFGNWIHHLKK